MISITVNGIKKEVPEGTLLSDILDGEMPCGGKGKCGKCKIFARGDLSEPSKTELELLSNEELLDGIRLSCLTYAYGDCEIISDTSSKKASIAVNGEMPAIELSPCFEKYGVAIDIGTTTLAARRIAATAPRITI